MSTNLAISTLEVVEMLHVKVPRAIVLLEGALTIENEADKPTINALKGVGLNLVVLPGKACEHHSVQVINEHQINNVQLALQ